MRVGRFMRKADQHHMLFLFAARAFARPEITVFSFVLHGVSVTWIDKITLILFTQKKLNKKIRVNKIYIQKSLEITIFVL